MKTFGSVCLAVAIAIAVVLGWQVASTQDMSGLLGGDTQQVVTQAPAQPVAVQASEDQAPAARIMQLPDDGQAWHLSVCLSDGWQGNQREKQIREWFFDGSLQLTSLRVQTQWHEYTPRHAMFRSLLAHRIPSVPAVVLQDASGYVVYASCESAKYRSIPSNPDDLADDIANAISARCQQVGLPAAECERCRPRPRPEPTPKPTPNVNVDVNVTKPIVPILDARPRPDSREFPWGLLAAVSAIVVLASVAYNFRREVSGQ